MKRSSEDNLIVLTQNFRRVIGVEMCAPAVEDAKINATLNGMVAMGTVYNIANYVKGYDGLLI